MVVGLVLASGFLRAAQPALGAPRVVSTRTTVLRSCTYASLVHAVVQGGVIELECTGTIDLPAPLVIKKGMNVTIIADEFVQLAGSNANGLDQLFVVDGGSLGLSDLTLGGEDNLCPNSCKGGTAADGRSGNAGASGAAGQPGAPGQAGSAGAAGASYSKVAYGGAIVVDAGSYLTVAY